MALPAIAAVLARLAPMIESVAASGGGAAAAGAAGRTAAAGSAASAGEGLAGMVGRMFGGGGAQAFGSSQELGGAIQRLEDIASITAALRESSAKAGQEQTATAARFREDERLYMMGSPDDTAKLSALERQRVDNANQQAEMRRESAALERRVRATTSPERSSGLGTALTVGATAAPLLSMLGGAPAASPGLAGQLTGAAGDIAAAPFGMLGGIARKLPPFAAAGNLAQAALQPATDLGVGREEGAVMGSAASFAAQGAKIATNPMAMLRGEGIAHMARLPGLIRDWGEALVDSKRGLMQFNGTIAAAFAEAERRGIVRSMESGSRIGGATAGLSDALQDLYDEVQPIKDAVTVVLSRGLESLIRTAEKGVEILKIIYEAMKMVPVMGEALDKIEAQIAKAGQGNANLPLHDFIRDVKDRPITAFPRAPRPGRP